MVGKGKLVSKSICGKFWGLKYPLPIWFHEIKRLEQPPLKTGTELRSGREFLQRRKLWGKIQTSTFFLQTRNWAVDPLALACWETYTSIKVEVFNSIGCQQILSFFHLILFLDQFKVSLSNHWKLSESSNIYHKKKLGISV